MVLEELLQTGKENPFCGHLFITMGPPWWFSVNNLPSDAGDSGLILGLGRSPEEEMATLSNIFAWRMLGQQSLAGYSP